MYDFAYGIFAPDPDKVPFWVVALVPMAYLPMLCMIIGKR